MASKTPSMTLYLRRLPLRASTSRQTCLRSFSTYHQLRASASDIVTSLPDAAHDHARPLQKESMPQRPCLAHLPTPNIVRNLMLGVVFSSPIIFNPGLAVLKIIANTKSALLNPDKNRLLRALLKPVLYKHFCAGENKAEVQRTIRDIKDLGFAGVILTNGKEIFFNAKSSSEKSVDLESDTNARMQANVSTWLNDNLKTLDMICEGDILALKLTGAGPEVAELLALGASMPDCLGEAFEKLCDRARAGGMRIWLDAEQRKIQPTIDDWAVQLMRQHNAHGDALILNTVQSYLKSSRKTIDDHLHLAHKEGWTLGIKLVRGAYIASEERNIIHDTKADTDDCYNGIVKDLMMKSWAGFSKSEFPKVCLFLAGHNQESVCLATTLARKLALKGEPIPVIGYGQLQGMADEVSCSLLAEGKEIQEECGTDLSESDGVRKMTTAPRAYKCLTWGSVQECMQYLVRRATENRGAADRIKEGLPLFRKELWRRMTTRSS